MVVRDAGPRCITVPHPACGSQVLAFAQPPYRNRYDRTATRIHGFFVDYLGVTGKPQRENTARDQSTGRGTGSEAVAANVVQDWRALVRVRRRGGGTAQCLTLWRRC